MMNIPTHCTNCETTEGVKFECRGCKFARFCSRDCLKKCWKKHKRYCMPLTDAVNESIEKLRPLLKNKYRIDDHENLHCMFCLEGGTSEDPLFHSGCACRPNSGMSIGHISCFQEFARASFSDKKKRNDSFHCHVDTCSHCSQPRGGIHSFEMCLILWKLNDPDCLTRQHVQITQGYKMKNALLCLNSALGEAYDSPVSDFINFCRLRILILIKNVRKQIQDSDDVQTEILDDYAIGNILICTEHHQAAIDLSRRNYEKMLIQDPQSKSLFDIVVRNYATSLLKAYNLSLKSNDPSYAYIEKAEQLMRNQIREHCHDIDIYVPDVNLLCRILMYQKKYTEANQILSPCLEKAQRVFGPSHPLTQGLLQLDANIRPYIM